MASTFIWFPYIQIHGDRSHIRIVDVSHKVNNFILRHIFPTPIYSVEYVGYFVLFVSRWQSSHFGPLCVLFLSYLLSLHHHWSVWLLTLLNFWVIVVVHVTYFFVAFWHYNSTHLHLTRKMVWKCANICFLLHFSCMNIFNIAPEKKNETIK